MYLFFDYCIKKLGFVINAAIATTAGYWKAHNNFDSLLRRKRKFRAILQSCRTNCCFYCRRWSTTADGALRNEINGLVYSRRRCSSECFLYCRLQNDDYAVSFAASSGSESGSTINVPRHGSSTATKTLPTTTTSTAV